MSYNSSVSISSLESDSEIRAMSLAIAHFARLQETISQCALTLCQAVFPVLRLPALLCPTLRPPAYRAPGLSTGRHIIACHVKYERKKFLPTTQLLQ